MTYMGVSQCEDILQELRHAVSELEQLKPRDVPIELMDAAHEHTKRIEGMITLYEGWIKEWQQEQRAIAEDGLCFHIENI